MYSLDDKFKTGGFWVQVLKFPKSLLSLYYKAVEFEFDFSFPLVRYKEELNLKNNVAIMC